MPIRYLSFRYGDSFNTAYNFIKDFEERKCFFFVYKKFF